MRSEVVWTAVKHSLFVVYLIFTALVMYYWTGGYSTQDGIVVDDGSLLGALFGGMDASTFTLLTVLCFLIAIGLVALHVCVIQSGRGVRPSPNRRR